MFDSGLHDDTITQCQLTAWLRYALRPLRSRLAAALWENRRLRRENRYLVRTLIRQRDELEDPVKWERAADQFIADALRQVR